MQNRSKPLCVLLSDQLKPTPQGGSVSDRRQQHAAPRTHQRQMTICCSSFWGLRQANGGAYATGPKRARCRKPVFHALPRISDTAVADLLQVIRTRVMRFLVRRHVVEADTDADTMLLPDDLAERDPALAQLAAAAVSGLPPAGPELRRKPLKIALPVGAGPKVVRPLCVEDAGFSLHAATRAGAEDDRGRAKLFNYVLRPPIAQEHVTLTADGLVAVKLKRPFRDGTVSVEMDPLSLISRLATSVHPPRFHSVRYGGVLTPGMQ